MQDITLVSDQSGFVKIQPMAAFRHMIDSLQLGKLRCDNTRNDLKSKIELDYNFLSDVVYTVYGTLKGFLGNVTLSDKSEKKYEDLMEAIWMLLNPNELSNDRDEKGAIILLYCCYCGGGFDDLEEAVKILDHEKKVLFEIETRREKAKLELEMMEQKEEIFDEYNIDF
jgi:hypothetical protein